MPMSVFLVWETALIKFKSSFSPKARNNFPIIDRIIESKIHVLCSHLSIFLRNSSEEVPDFNVQRSNFARVLETQRIQVTVFPKIIVAIKKKKKKAMRRNLLAKCSHL